MHPLQIESLGHNFGGLRAVNDVSFAVEQGERLALIGPNGAGKTTLFNLLSGELVPSEGRILLHGTDITRLSPAQRARRGIGRTFQRNNLFPSLSVYENVQLAVQQRLGVAGRLFRPARHFETLRQETFDLLATLDLTRRATAPASTLSYGEQRQLEVALALALRPEILLLDEPTAGMSTAETTAMTRMIAALPREITVLIIEHDMDLVFNLADRIIVLHYGQVIADGPPEAVREDPRVREIYLGVDEDIPL